MLLHCIKSFPSALLTSICSSVVKFLKMPPFAEKSWPEIPYPSKRDEGIPNVESWLEGRKIDDGAENLWRVHDKLYDLNSFVEQHPGGAMWLSLTKGTDITEAFECHHLTPAAEKLLPKFYVKDATSPRSSPFTFKPNGFFRTIKRKVLKHFDYKTPQISRISTTFLDLFFFSALTFSVLAAKHESIGFAALAGVMFGFVINCGHNFVHMKDMWRNYYYYFTGFSVRDWRISHCLSHHLYPNTLQDLEISLFEPTLQFLPNKNKPTWARFGPLLYSPIVWALAPAFQIFNKVRLGTFFLPNYLVFVPPVLMLILGNFQFYTILLWIDILLFIGLTFTSIGLTAAHHDYESFHEGDKPRDDTDWGLHQVDAIHERKELIGNTYVGLVVFGEHTLHHLFPTIDHVHLKELIPIFKETLEEFGVPMNEKSYPEIIANTFVQLARNRPNMIVRKQKKA
ncbi:cytochrome b5-related protein-like isoform X2 [Planococcus citri]|uniref:cytochrome b5-related protein-like isoform X2 n=1 Tax=Planococcus citri TaxID=170843 RepID=UPI0031F9DDE2